MMEFYAIKHKPTGHFLPKPVGYMGRGGSHVEPVDCSDNKAVPRLFENKRGAVAALTHWLKGKYVVERVGEHWSGDFYYESEEFHSVIQQSHRKRDEMEIVVLRLVEIPS